MLLVASPSGSALEGDVLRKKGLYNKKRDLIAVTGSRSFAICRNYTSPLSTQMHSAPPITVQSSVMGKS